MVIAGVPAWLAIGAGSTAEAAPTELPATIATNTTLTSEGSPYFREGLVTIAPGVTLTIEPGVAVKVESLTANGTLDAEGTTKEPIVFTSLEDKEPGEWDGIEINSSESVLDQVEIRNATTAITSSGAIQPVISNSTIRHSSETAIALDESEATVEGNELLSNDSGIAITGGGAPEIAANEVANCEEGRFGVLFEGSKGDVGEVNIHGNEVEGCGAAAGEAPLPASYAAISVESGGAEVTGVSLGENIVKNGGRPIDYHVDPADGTIPPDIAANSLSGNETNAIWVAGEVAESAEWADPGHPLVMHEGESLQVGPEASLTLGPGLVLKAEAEGNLWIRGELEVAGAAEGPVTLTSIKDDSVGGDTNGDGTETEPAPGDWNSIELAPGRGDLKYLHARYGGSLGYWTCEECGGSPMVTVAGFGEEEPEPSTVELSTFRDGAGPAIAGFEASTVVAGNLVESSPNGMLFVHGGSPEIAENTVIGDDSGGFGIFYKNGSEITISRRGGEGGTLDPTDGAPGQINIHDNVVEGFGADAESDSLPANPGAISVYVGNEESEAWAIGVSLGGNTVSSGGRPIDFFSLSHSPAVPPDISENTLSGNEANGIWLQGVIGLDMTWLNHGFPFVLTGPRVYGTEVESGHTLTLAPGLAVKSEPETVMGVKGGLVVLGTEEDPVVFTSVKDDTVWGDTNGDGAKSVPARGDWTGIQFLDGTAEAPPGVGEITHLTARYGGEESGCPSCVEGGAMIAFGAPEPGGPKGSRSVLVDSQLQRSRSSAVFIAGGFGEKDSPIVSWNKIRDNEIGIEKGGGPEVKVPHNSFGSPSGPKPGGVGDPVAGPVDPTPINNPNDPDAKCRGKDHQCPEGGDPVGLATGELNYQHRDLLLTNDSEQPLEFSRAYSSGNDEDSGLGVGWSLTGLMSATELRDGDVVVIWPDGHQDRYERTEGGFVPPPGITDRLEEELYEGDRYFYLEQRDRTAYAFNPAGRLDGVYGPHGVIAGYAYDGKGRLERIEDSSEQYLEFEYDPSNHLALVTDSTGREVGFEYNAEGELASATDALGGVTKYTYDSEHRLKTIEDPRGNVILQNTYDGQGRIVEQLDGLEHLWTLEYEEGETIVTEPEGGQIAYGFDGQNRLVSETDQLGKATTTSYDEAGLVDEVVRPGGAKWQYGYDEAGNLTSAIDPEGGERSYEYDGLNHLTSFTDELERSWDYEWDEDNDLVKITDPAEGETTLTHDTAGLPLTVTDANEHTTTFTYDARGNRLSAEDALGHTTAYEYDARNYLTSRTAPGLDPEAYERNALGDLLSVTTPEGNKTEYAYDANGLLTEVIDPAEGVWQIERDAMERPTAYVDPLEQRSEISYDGNLRPIGVVDRRGKETTYAYDLANRLTEIVRPEGGDWEFGYDDRGNRTEVVEPRENASTYEFDLADRMTKATEPLGAVTGYGYDLAGNLTSVTDPRENTTEFSYDELGRLTDVEQPLEKTTTFTYDGVGNRTMRTTAEGTVSFEYDAANRLQEIAEGEATLRAFEYDAANRMIGATDAQSDEIEVGYDDDGRVVSIDDGRGRTVAREYDSRGNVIEQTDGRGTLEYEFDKLSRMVGLTDPQAKALDFEYDPEGNLTEVDLPNGVLTTNEYDDASRLAETTSAKGETVLESLEYEYDPAGNRIGQVDRLSQETTYGYDALNRLVGFDPPGEGSTEYGYDAAGNRTEAAGVTYNFNALNQLTSSSDGKTYDYDGAGRLVEVDHGELSTTFGWNPLDELTSVDTGTEEIDYTYDALGRQASRDNGSAIRLSHYGDLSDIPILDADAEGEPTMTYVQGPVGLVEQRSEGATSFPLRDAHGDITTLANDEGEVASRQTYDPWGDQLTGPSLEMGWLGAQQRRSDPTTELAQMGVRSYGPGQGQFLSEDPVVDRVGIGATANRYSYGSNDPINRNDLSGRETCVPTPFGTACAPVTVHPPVPTPSNPVPELPVTIDGIPTPAQTINDAIPDPPTPSLGEIEAFLRHHIGELADRALSFLQKHGGQLFTGCVTGGAAGFLLFNTATGGTPVAIPGIGWLTEGGSALLGCGIGGVGLATTGVNPVRRS